MEIIRTGRPEDGRKIRDFADFCFEKKEPLDKFVSLVPGLYREPEKSAAEHLLLEADGELKGLLCRIVTEWKVGGRTLKVGHIGSVCVAPEYREHGGMRKLMTQAMEDFKAEGCALAALSGQRQRYEHYGFVPTGIKTEFWFNRKNMKGVKAEGYALRAYEPGDLEEVRRLFEQTGIYMERSGEGFLDHLTAWSASPWVFFDENGVCGYCTVLPGEGVGAVSELRLGKPELLATFVRLLLDRGYYEVKISITPDAPEYALASAFCEAYKIGTNHNIRVFQFAPLAEALLQWKNRRASLPHGRLELSIAGFGRLEMKVDENGAAVRLAAPRTEGQAGAVDKRKSEEQAEAKETALTYEQAVHLLFSPLSPEREQLIWREPLAALWLPLPLYVEENDCY